MRFRVRLKPAYGGGWYARCNDAPNGVVEGEAPTPEAALEKVRAEIRFRLELCPCSGVSDDFVELEVERQASPRGNAWPAG